MIKINWRVNGLPIIISNDKKIYRESFYSNMRYYPYKEIYFKIHQGNEYLLVNRKRYSKKYIRENLYRVNEYLNLFENNSDIPF